MQADFRVKFMVYQTYTYRSNPTVYGGVCFLSKPLIPGIEFTWRFWLIKGSQKMYPQLIWYLN